MDPARFGTLVRALEQRAQRYPRLYRAQVAAVAALGYLYVGGVLLLLLGLVAGLVYAAIQVRGGGAVLGKLLLPVAGLAYVLLRSLWIRVPDLEGLPLPAEQFPALAEAIEKVRAQVDAPRFRRVLLDGDFNAAVAQRPRFGILGPSVSDLVLGLPLMQALSPAEFEAVLAHEMGHVSRQHGRFGHWIYRVRTTWGRLSEAVSAGGSTGTSLLLGKFLSWYAPFFGAYSFVLARLDEYEADQASVRVAGRATVAAALMRIEVLSRFHAERHWGAISRELNGGGTVQDPHAAFVRRLAVPPDRRELDQWLAEAMRRKTDHTDTHPCLADRLRAIGAAASPALPPSPGEPASALLLGASADALARELDQRWWTQVEPQVARARAEHEAAGRRLDELDAGAQDNDAGWERIELLDRLGRASEARAAAEGVLAARPDDARVLFFVGRVLLEADEAEGIALLERSAALHPPAAPAVQALIFQYHMRRGQAEQADEARGRLTTAHERITAAARERASLAEAPLFVPHGLPEEKLEPLRAAVRNIPGVRDIYLTRRVVVEMPEVPCYFVGVAPAGAWWKFRKRVKGDQLRDAVIAATDWPQDTYFVVGEGHHTGLVRRMKKVPGARLTGADAAAASPSMDPMRLEALRTGLIRRRGRRRRSTLALYAGVVAVVLLVGWGLEQREQVIATTPIRQFTVADAAARVRDARGHLLVLVLYHPEQTEAALVADLRRWVAPMNRSHADLLALAVGSRRDAQAFFRYAGERGNPRLAPLWLEPWPSGTLDSTMGTLGVQVGKQWTSPLAVVFDSTGRVVAQWQGQLASGPVIVAARAALAHQ